jgi:SAM-dependent methyltransferase
MAHARVDELAFDYGSQPKIAVERCNMCGGRTFVVLAHRDRYGYGAQAAGCTRCGLVFLNPVMTREAYGHFYEGTYRPLVSAYHGRLIDEHTIQGEQRQYAGERAAFLAPYLEGRGHRTMLDIGGSTGVVTHVLATRFGLRPTVVDPAPLETAEAQSLGIEVIEGLVEAVDFGARRFDVVTLCQTVDHLLDLDGTLRRARELLADDGVLFFDIVDFRAAYLRHWSIEEAIKIDHPYYLNEFTTEAWLQRVGFEVLRREYEADHLHVGYVARRAAPTPAALPDPADVRDLWREVRFVQNARR